jgi:hypothetical protein
LLVISTALFRCHNLLHFAPKNTRTDKSTTGTKRNSTFKNLPQVFVTQHCGNLYTIQRRHLHTTAKRKKCYLFPYEQIAKRTYDFSYLLPLCVCNVKLSGPSSLFPTSPRSTFEAISNWLIQHTQLSAEQDGLHPGKRPNCL